LNITALKAAPEHLLELSITEQYSIPYKQVQEIQLAGAQLRFGDLVERVPMLTKLAEQQKLSEINKIEDLAPLLVVHSAYKSYPLSVLESARFDRLTRWLNGFTAYDLSALDVSDCEMIDDWVGVLNRQTPLRVLHSSGTSGKLSFIPRSQSEVTHSVHGHLRMLEGFGDEPPALGVPVDETVLICPGYRHGAAALQRWIDALEAQIFKDESRIVALNPGYFSADLLSIGGRLQAAENKGEVGRVQISPKLLARRDAFSKEQAEAPARMDAFLDRLEQLRGRCVWFIGGTGPALYNIAAAGEKRGIKNLFRADSFATGGGGAKGKLLPEGWDTTVKQFLGVAKLNPAYGMSELPIMSRICPMDHYHLPPWWVPFLLDPDSGAQLPRTGTHKGRHGVFDLNARTYWGGFLTGDEVTLSWGDTEPCGCGRIGPYVHKSIRRYTAQEGGDDKINCAGSPRAHDQALDYLLAALG
jgi:hypothetical protein